MPFRKGTIVFDRCTNQHGMVESHHTRKDDGRWVTYYKLSGVPRTPNYPTGWRYHREVATAKR
jgi:hypothetical protein